MGSNLLLDLVILQFVYGIYSLNHLYIPLKVIEDGSSVFDLVLTAKDLLQVVWTRISKFGIHQQENYEEL